LWPIARNAPSQAKSSSLLSTLERSRAPWKLNHTVADWLGEEGDFRGARLRSSVDSSEEDFACDGAFLAIGHKPLTGLLAGQLEMDEHGYLLWKQHTMTSVPGVFAAGDVVDTRYRQAVTAAGMGCMAAMDAEKWIEAQ